MLIGVVCFIELKSWKFGREGSGSSDGGECVDTRTGIHEREWVI